MVGVASFFWFDRYISDVDDVQLSYSVVPIVVSVLLLFHAIHLFVGEVVSENVIVWPLVQLKAFVSTVLPICFKLF